MRAILDQGFGHVGNSLANNVDQQRKRAVFGQDVSIFRQDDMLENAHIVGGGGAVNDAVVLNLAHHVGAQAVSGRVDEFVLGMLGEDLPAPIDLRDIGKDRPALLLPPRSLQLLDPVGARDVVPGREYEQFASSLFGNLQHMPKRS